MNTQVIIRIDPELKNKVNYLAKSEGKNVSELVRELLKDYVKNRDIDGYIDDLWDRIGTKLKKQDFDESKVNSVINQVRSQKK